MRNFNNHFFVTFLVHKASRYNGSLMGCVQTRGQLPKPTTNLSLELEVITRANDRGFCKCSARTVVKSCK